MTYTNGYVCDQDTGERYSFGIHVYCDKQTQIDYNPTAHGSICSPYVQVVSQYGCDVLQVNAIWEIIEKYESLWGAVLIIIGIPFCFLGRYLIKPSICIATTLTTIFISLLFFYTIFFDDDQEVSNFFIVFGCSLLAGIIFGIILAKYIKIGAAILGAWGGFAVALILNETLIYRVGAEWLFWVTIIICSALAAFLTFRVFDHAMIITTALLGAYLMMRGISLYAGHYYNEFEMAQLVKDGLLENIDKYYWCYVAAFIIFFLVGFYMQYKAYKTELRNQKQKSANHPYLDSTIQV